VENHDKFCEHLKAISSFVDGIYRINSSALTQQREVEIRDAEALKSPEGIEALLREVSGHHSIEVMKREIKKFIDSIPYGGIILDVGAGWGWQWVGISTYRPDLLLCFLDFSEQSLLTARKVLSNESSRSILYINGSATDLKFESESINGYWSVQTLQHVNDFNKAISEAHRVLIGGSPFASYSLNTQPIIRFLYRFLGRKYVIDGEYVEGINLSRASSGQRAYIEYIFGTEVDTRFTEVLFSPEILLKFPGRHKSIIGKIDNLLSGNSMLARSFARQCSFHTLKKI
jgi:SAM-dependent methyltransferase